MNGARALEVRPQLPDQSRGTETIHRFRQRPPRRGLSPMDWRGDGLTRSRLVIFSRRQEIILRRLELSAGDSIIYVHALDANGQAAGLGLRAGCTMRALRDPHREELWPVTGSEKLSFIRTNWEITDEIKMVFEREPSVTREMVTRASSAREARRVLAAAPQQRVARDRPDLYSSEWEGDKYVGDNVNILTVCVALLIIVSVVGIGYGLAVYKPLRVYLDA